MTTETKWTVKLMVQDGVSWEDGFLPPGTYASVRAATDAVRAAIADYLASGEVPIPPSDPHGQLIHDAIDFIAILERSNGARATGYARAIRAEWRPATAETAQRWTVLS